MDRRWGILLDGTTAPQHHDNDNIDGDNERGGGFGWESFALDVVCFSDPYIPLIPGDEF